METSEFIRKLTSKYLWLNLFAMGVVITLLVLGTGIAMDIYTHHGETITVPDVRKHSYEASVKVLEVTVPVLSHAPLTVIVPVPSLLNRLLAVTVPSKVKSLSSPTDHVHHVAGELLEKEHVPPRLPVPVTLPMVYENPGV